MHEPITTDTGQRTAGLRLGDRRVHALLQALLIFRLLPAGFRNRDLRQLLGGLLGELPAPSPPDKSATTCVGCAPTASSPAFPEPTDTDSATPVATTPCC